MLLHRCTVNELNVHNSKLNGKDAERLALCIRGFVVADYKEVTQYRRERIIHNSNLVILREHPLAGRFVPQILLVRVLDNLPSSLVVNTLVRPQSLHA